MPRKHRAAIVVVLALAGAGALVGDWYRSRRDPDPRAMLAAAMGSELAFDARLTGGFLPSAGRIVRRSAAGGEATLPPDARIAIAQLEKRAAADPSPKALADLGVAYLVQGDVDRSIALLGDAAAQGPRAAAWSDLAAAYLVKADRVPARNVEYLSRALDAASQSLRLAPSNEALFNRALALDGLAPFVGAASPWAGYLAIERDQPWRTAATQRLESVRPREDSRTRWDGRLRELRSRLTALDRAYVAETATEFPEATLEFFEQELLVHWANAVENGDTRRAHAALREAKLVADAVRTVTDDSMSADEVHAIATGASILARAHLAYADGVRAYDGNDYARARGSFERALAGFSRANSRYRDWAAAQLATILFQERNLTAADQQLASVESSARARGYSTLLARTLWLRGLVYSKQWRLTEALGAFRNSASLFEQANEREYAVSLHHHVADALHTLGEQRESWEYVGRTLEGLSRVRKPVRRYLFLYNAALFALGLDLLEPALLFQDAAVRESLAAGVEVAVEAHTQRAAIHLRRHDVIRAREDLGTAVAHLARMPDGPLEKYLAADIDVLQAQVGQDDPGDRAVGQLRGAIAFFDRAEPARVPRLYLALARAHLAHRANAAAEEALNAGIERLERQQATLDDESLKISYFDEAWDLFQEMVQLQHATRQDSEKAFEYAERSRARSLLASAEGSNAAAPRRLDAIQALLPAGLVLVHYAVLADRVLIWTVSSGSFRLVEQRFDRQDLARLVARHRAAIVEGRESGASNDRLYALLIRPVADALLGSSTVVLAPDGELQQLSFATLRDPATRRYFVEDHTLAVTPSASFFAAGLLRAHARGAASFRSALLVGNPAASTTDGLPGAEAEVGAAARFYPRRDVLTGSAATKARFLKSAPEYDVVHFGGHAFVNAEFPLLSRLQFSADDASDEQHSLFAHEISRLRLPQTRLVVLAACSTAVGAISRGEGAVSVARPFLGAGVPLVIASQWDVDDRATGQLFLAFHRELARSQDPVAALRAAQLSLLRSGDRRASSPASWGAFVALGITAR